MVAVSKLGKTRRFRDQHPHHLAAAAILDDVLIHEAELGAQQIGGRALWVSSMPCTVSNVGLGDLAHHRDEEVLLVLEVDVDRALGDAGAFGDLVERR